MVTSRREVASLKQHIQQLTYERSASTQPSLKIEASTEVISPVQRISRSAQATPISIPKGRTQAPIASDDDGLTNELRIANRQLAEENESLLREIELLRRSKEQFQHPLKRSPAVIDEQMMEETASHLREVEMALKGLCEYRTRMQVKT